MLCMSVFETLKEKARDLILGEAPQSLDLSFTPEKKQTALETLLSQATKEERLQAYTNILNEGGFEGLTRLLEHALVDPSGQMGDEIMEAIKLLHKP